MNRTLAETLMEQLLDLSASMQVVAGHIEWVDAEEKRQQMRRGIANLMSALYSDLVLPVLCEYPDLDPEQADETV